MVVHPPHPSQGMLALVPWVRSEYGGRVKQLESDIAFHIGKQERESRENSPWAGTVEGRTRQGAGSGVTAVG